MTPNPQTTPPLTKLVILDCDGVMFDSREANIRYYNDMRAAFGLPPMDAAERDFVHMHDDKSAMRHIFREHPEITAEALDRLSRSTDDRPYLAGMVMSPGLPEFLAEVRTRGFTAVATNRTDSMDMVLETFHLKPLFDFVMTAGLAPPKPAPDGPLLILEHFGLHASEALFIGDSQVDADTARAAGLPFAAFGNPALEADWHVASFAEARLLPPIQSLLQGPFRR